MNLFFILFLLTTTNLLAKTYQLKELISLVKEHPEIKIEQLEINKAQNIFMKIDGEMRPKITILSGIGPNKSARGDALNSLNSDNVDTLTTMATIDLKIPVFMFDRQLDLTKAAEGNLKIKELDLEKKKNFLIKKIKEFYYGFQYASALNDFAESSLRDLNEAIVEMKNKSKKNDDLVKLEIFKSLLQVKKYELEKGQAQAILGLKYITEDASPKIEQDWLEYSPKKIPSLVFLNQNIEKTNFDLKMAHLGVEARSAFLTSEKKSLLPVFGIFSSFDYKNTRKSNKQESNFAYDPYNRSAFTVGVGLIWEIDFGIKTSNVSNAQADLTKIKMEESFAQKNLPLKIEKLYLDLLESQKKIEELEHSYKSSKKLLNTIATGAAFGITPSKEIIESYTLKAQVYQQYMEAIYNYELRLAELSLEVGIELDSSLL